MCSASFDGVRPAAGAGAAVASAVQPVPAAFPERVKVVALVAAIMLLCNADRVVMSVAVVPLAAQYGWSSSFVGIVQVDHLSQPSLLSLFRLLKVEVKQRSFFSQEIKQHICCPVAEQQNVLSRTICSWLWLNKVNPASAR
jgi:hypothetical protein